MWLMIAFRNNRELMKNIRIVPPPDQGPLRKLCRQMVGHNNIIVAYSKCFLYSSWGVLEYDALTIVWFRRMEKNQDFRVHNQYPWYRNICPIFLTKIICCHGKQMVRGTCWWLWMAIHILSEETILYFKCAHRFGFLYQSMYYRGCLYIYNIYIERYVDSDDSKWVLNDFIFRWNEDHKVHRSALIDGELVVDVFKDAKGKPM